MIPTPHPSPGLSPEASPWLAKVVDARAAMERATHDVSMAADELRRHAKFARPGQPSVHVVQLRRNQAAARLESARARQAFLKAAHAFVHATGWVVPPRVSLEAFVLEWLDRNATGPMP